VGAAGRAARPDRHQVRLRHGRLECGKAHDILHTPCTSTALPPSALTVRDGAPVRSCVLPVSALRPGQKITTIEGLSADGSHPVQKAWAALDVPQCGYCQSGMIMAAARC
jgi:hypothetical protein